MGVEIGVGPVNHGVTVIVRGCLDGDSDAGNRPVFLNGLSHAIGFHDRAGQQEFFAAAREQGRDGHEEALAETVLELPERAVGTKTGCGVFNASERSSLSAL